MRWLSQTAWRRVVYYRRIDEYCRRGGALDNPDDFDAAYGVETHSFVRLSDLTIAGSGWVHGVDYQPVPTAAFREAMDALRIRHEEFVFVDIGCGKGKPLLLASEYPFRRIVGVEFSPELHEAASRNIERFRSPHQRCFDLAAVCADATEFVLPEEPLVLHLFNPFGERLMARFLRHLGESLRNCPRPVYIVYVYPTVRGLLDEAPFLRFAQSGEGWSIYCH